MAIHEFVEPFLRHEQNDFIVLGKAERQADRGRRDAVVGNIFAVDAQRSLTEFTGNAGAALGDMRKYQNALGSCDQVFVLWIELKKQKHRGVDTLIDLGLGGAERYRAQEQRSDR
jgi:hypothetical protein